MAWPRSWFIGHSTPDGGKNSERTWIASIMVFTGWKQSSDEKVCFAADRKVGRGKRAAARLPSRSLPSAYIQLVPAFPHPFQISNFQTRFPTSCQSSVGPLDHVNPVPANAANMTQLSSLFALLLLLVARLVTPCSSLHPSSTAKFPSPQLRQPFHPRLVRSQDPAPSVNSTAQGIPIQPPPSQNGSHLSRLSARSAADVVYRQPIFQRGRPVPLRRMRSRSPF